MINRWFYEPKNLKSKCIHIVMIDNLYSDIYKYTSSSIENFAKKIKADINLITKPKFLDFPPNYERMQIWEDGKDYQWNINIGADTIIHPEAEDPTLRIDPLNSIGTLYSNNASHHFNINAYFIRHRICEVPFGSLLISSWFTHDIWEPLQMSSKEMASFCTGDKKMVSEFNLAVNLCKYDYKLDKAFIDPFKTHTMGLGNIAIQKIKNKLKEWGEL